jgi:hypothetical protein
MSPRSTPDAAATSSTWICTLHHQLHQTDDTRGLLTLHHIVPFFQCSLIATAAGELSDMTLFHPAPFVGDALIMYVA